jgi:hypothetical protein
MIQSFRVPVRDNSVFSSFRRQQIGFCARALDKDGCHEILQFGLLADTHSGAPTGKTVVTKNTGAYRRPNTDVGYRMKWGQPARRRGVRQQQVMNGHPRPEGGGTSADTKRIDRTRKTYSPNPGPETRIKAVMTIKIFPFSSPASDRGKWRYKPSPKTILWVKFSERKG